MMERQPETTIFNPEAIDWLLESVVDRAAAATIRSKLIDACHLVEQKDASATETLRQAETLRSEADEKSRLLDDERNALFEEKEKFLQDAKQLTSLPEAVTTLTSTLSSAMKEARDRMAQSLEDMANAAKSHQVSIESSSGETSRAIRDIKAVGGSIGTSLSGINESFEHSLKPEHIAELTRGFTDSVKTLTESIKGIPANVRAGLKEETTLESFFKPFELRDKLSLKEEELKKETQENQRLIDQLQTLRGSKAEVDLLLQQEKDRVGRRNEYVLQLQSELEVAEKQVEDIPELQRQLEEARLEADQIPELQRQLQAARTEAGRVRSLSTDLEELGRLYDVAQGKVRSQGERLDSQTGRILQLEERETKTQQRARDLEESRSNFEAQIEQLTENLQDIQTLHEEAKESFKGRLEDKVELLKAKERQLESLQKNAEDLEGLQQRFKKVEDLNHGLVKDLASSNSDASSYLGELRDSLAHAAELQRKIDKADHNAKCLGKELDTAKASLSDAEENCVHLQGQLCEANALIDEIQTQLSSQETQSSSQGTQRSLQTPEGVIGELADMYSNLSRRTQDIPVVPERLAAFDLNTVAVKIAPLIFQFEGMENLQEFVNSGRNGWYCLKSVVDGSISPDGLETRKCSEHDGDCVLVCTRNRENQFFLDFHEPEL